MITTTENRADTLSARERQVIEFFARWGESFEACCDSFRELLAEGCIWDQRPMPRLTGPRQAVRFLEVARATLGLATIDVEILHIASAGEVVHVERIDRLRRADGSLIAAAPVAGVLQFHLGQVVRWREYFDSAEFVAQTLATSCLHPVRRIGRLVAATARARRQRGHGRVTARGSRSRVSD